MRNSIMLRCSNLKIKFFQLSYFVNGFEKSSNLNGFVKFKSLNIFLLGKCAKNADELIE